MQTKQLLKVRPATTERLLSIWPALAVAELEISGRWWQAKWQHRLHLPFAQKNSCKMDFRILLICLVRTIREKKKTIIFNFRVICHWSIENWISVIQAFLGTSKHYFFFFNSMKRYNCLFMFIINNYLIKKMGGCN